MSRFPSSVRFEYDEAHSSNFTRGTWRKDFIVIHHWDDPAKRPQFGGVVSWFKNPSANVSIQYMVEAGRITQMIPESAMAWHAGNSTANRHGIGIELNPRQSDGDYETAAQLVAEIWGRRGKLPLRKHREFFGTSCPGTWDVSRIQRRAEQIYSGTTTAGTVLEGEVMSWSDRTYDYVNEDETTARHQLAKAHEYGWSIWSRIRDNDWRKWLWRHRGYDYVNENANTKDHQIARAHQYSMQARSEAREVKAMVKAMAKAQDELLQGQGKILKAVEDAEVQVVKANAAEVAAELEVSVKEEEED